MEQEKKATQAALQLKTEQQLLDDKKAECSLVTAAREARNFMSSEAFHTSADLKSMKPGFLGNLIPAEYKATWF